LEKKPKILDIWREKELSVFEKDSGEYMVFITVVAPN